MFVCLTGSATPNNVTHVSPPQYYYGTILHLSHRDNHSNNSPHECMSDQLIAGPTRVLNGPSPSSSNSALNSVGHRYSIIQYCDVVERVVRYFVLWYISCAAAKRAACFSYCSRLGSRIPHTRMVVTLTYVTLHDAG